MKKILLIPFVFLFLTSCSQYTAMLGPGITLAETGSVLQASTSYGSSYSMGIVRKNISEELKAERHCSTHHSTELAKIFFETQDRENCIFDPMSIYR